jgi:molybdenum cofactor cytidylyltransferase
VEAALGGMLDPVLVVTGHDEAGIRNALCGLAVTFVHNPQFADGLSTSLRTGIDRLPTDCDGAMVLLGDMPGVSADLVMRLRQAFTSDADIVAAAANNRSGHPVLWGRKFFREFAQLRGDNGARELLARHAEQVRLVEADDHSPLVDIDTPADLSRFDCAGEFAGARRPAPA